MNIVNEKMPFFDISSQYGAEQLYDFFFRGIQGWLLRSYKARYDDLTNFYRSYSNTLPGFIEGVSETDMMDCLIALNAMLYGNVYPDQLVFHKFKKLYLIPVQSLKLSQKYINYKKNISKMYNFFVEGYLKFLDEKISCAKTNDFYAHFSHYLFKDPHDLIFFKKHATEPQLLIFFEKVKAVYLKYICGAYPNLDCFDGIFAFTNYGHQVHSPFEICLRGKTYKDIISSHSLGLLEDFCDNKKGAALKADLHNVISNLGITLDTRELKALLTMISTDKFTYEQYKKFRAEPEGRAILQQQLNLFLSLRQEGGCLYAK